jgi:hypothetical protein
LPRPGPRETGCRWASVREAAPRSDQGGTISDLTRDSQKNQVSGEVFAFRRPSANRSSSRRSRIHRFSSRTPSTIRGSTRGKKCATDAPAAVATAVCCSCACPFTRGKHRGTVTRTDSEAATHSQDGQTKGVAKTFKAYDAEISTWHTSRGQGRRVGPANEAPTSEDSSIDSESGRGMAR